MSTVLAIDASNFIARYTFANPSITPQGLIKAARHLAERPVVRAPRVHR